MEGHCLFGGGHTYRLVYNRYSNALTEDGKIFSYSPVMSLANNGTANYLIKTPASPKVTLYEFDVSSDNSPVFHTLYEDVVVSANGTLASAFNNNRQSSTTAGTLIYTSPTITSTGTLLSADITTGGKLAGGVSLWEFRIIFKASANYLVQLTNSSGNPANISLFLKWAET